MKIPEKQLASKADFSTFLQLDCSNFRLKLWKGYRITKIVNEIKFEGVWDKIEAKNCFHRQSFTKDLRQHLVFV